MLLFFHSRSRPTTLCIDLERAKAFDFTIYSNWKYLTLVWASFLLLWLLMQMLDSGSVGAIIEHRSAQNVAEAAPDLGILANLCHITTRDDLKLTAARVEARLRTVVS